MKNYTGYYLYNLSAFTVKKQSRNKDIKDRKKQETEKHTDKYIEIHDIGMLYK